MINILYVTCMEVPYNSAIFKSQVKTLLITLRKKYATNTRISLSINIPVIYITRKGIINNYTKYKREYEFLANECESNGVSLRVNPICTPLLIRHAFHLNVILLPLILLLGLPKLYMEVLRVKPNIIHCRSYPATLMAVIIKKFKKKIRIIFDMRGLYPEEGIVQKRWSEKSYAFKLWKWIELQLLRNSECIVVLSETFADYVLSLDNNLKNKIEFIPAGVDTKSFAGSDNYREKQTIIENNNIFISHGTLNLWHNPNILASVFCKINSIVPNAHLVVLTSFNRTELNKIMLDHGIKKTNYNIKQVPYEDVPQYLARARYAIVPSAASDITSDVYKKRIVETMIGLKVSESLAAGLPLIANENIGGLRRLMSNHNLGILFNINKMDEFKSNYCAMDSNYDEIRRECLQFAEKHLDIEYSADRYYEIYEKLAQI
jgi:glycosyltransferase involved in cell wall biosynthesis